jgi:hypothetical protein
MLAGAYVIHTEFPEHLSPERAVASTDAIGPWSLNRRTLFELAQRAQISRQKGLLEMATTSALLTKARRAAFHGIDRSGKNHKRAQEEYEQTIPKQLVE